MFDQIFLTILAVPVPVVMAVAVGRNHVKQIQCNCACPGTLAVIGVNDHMDVGLLSLFPDYIKERYQRTDGIWMGD